MERRAQLFKDSWITLAASLAVVAIMALPGRASAATFDYGPQSSDFYYGVFKPAGSFTDDILFSVATPFTVTLQDNFPNFSLVSGLNATIYNSVSAPVYSGAANTPVTGSSFQNLVPATLAAGSYDLRISGLALGPASTSYYSGKLTLATTAMPIPEPETYAMILAGLGLMGFVARRRKQKDVA